MMMKNVAIINISDYGSTGKIATGLYTYLKSKGYNPLLCCGRGQKTGEDKVIILNKYEKLINIVIDRLLGDQGCHEYFVTQRLLNYLDKKNIDSMYIVCLHSNYINEEMLFRYVIKRKIPIVYIMIDEYPYLGKCAYNGGCENYKTGCGNCPQIRQYPESWFFDRSKKKWNIKKKYYPQMNSIFVAPQYVIQKAKESPLMDGMNLQVLDEAVDIDRFKPYSDAKEKLGLPKDKILIVTVVPYRGVKNRKGGYYFHELAKSMSGDDRYQFIHVGCKAQIENCPPNILCYGYVSDQEQLALFYSAADLFIFPSLDDTMPNTCLEALACGSPLLCFNVSGMPYIADDECATFVEPANVEQMQDVVSRTKTKDADTIERCRRYAINRYDSKIYFEKLEKYMQLQFDK